MKLRRRSLGNIRFIEELYKIKMHNGDLAFKSVVLWFLFGVIRSYNARVYLEVAGTDLPGVPEVPLQARHQFGAGNGDHLIDSQYPNPINIDSALRMLLI